MAKKVNIEGRRSLAERFAKWVKKCNYVESADRTQAAIDIYIEGITGGLNILSLAGAVGCDFIDEGLVTAVAMDVAYRFCDAVSIAGTPEYRVEPFKDSNDGDAKRLVIKADVRLVDGDGEESWLSNTNGKISIR